MEDFTSASFFVRGLLMDVCRPLLLSLLLSISCGFLICALFLGYGSLVADGVSAHLESPGYSCVVHAPAGGHIDWVSTGKDVYRNEVLGRVSAGDVTAILAPCDGHFTVRVGLGNFASSDMSLGVVVSDGNMLVRLPIEDRKNIEGTWQHIRVFYDNHRWIPADIVSNNGKVAVFRLRQPIFLSSMHESIPVRLFPVLSTHAVLDYLLSPLIHRL